MESIEKDILELVSKVAKVPADMIDPNADIFKDLKIDSLIGVEIFAALDKKYGIDIPEKQLGKIRTLNDIIVVVKQKKGV